MTRFEPLDFSEYVETGHTALIRVSRWGGRNGSQVANNNLDYQRGKRLMGLDPPHTNLQCTQSASKHMGIVGFDPSSFSLFKGRLSSDKKGSPEFPHAEFFVGCTARPPKAMKAVMPDAEAEACTIA